MKISIFLAVLLSGCATTYKVERCTVIEGKKVCSKAFVKSRREFPKGLQFKYNSETGDFQFHTNQVDNTISPLEAIGLEVAKKALDKIDD